MDSAGTSGGRLARLAALAALAAAPALLFFPVLLDRVPAMRDFPRWTWPGRALWRAAILDGRLPQWNPFVGLGAPMPAAPVHGTFYPGHLLLLAPWPATVALSITWVLHAILAGVGGYALARRVGCRRTVAVAAGLSWQLGGYAISMWGDGEKVLSGAWVPWAALGIASTIGAERAGAALAGAAAALAMLAMAGDPFLWAHALALGLAVGWGLRTERGGTARFAVTAMARTAMAAGLAVLIAGVAFVPAGILMQATERAGGLARDVAENWSLPPHRIPALFAPFVGSGENDWATSLYLGATVMTLAAAAGRTRATLALWAAAVLGLLAALGEHTPIHAGLRWVLPPLRYMRFPEKHILVTTGAVTLLAAIGTERALRLERGKLPRGAAPAAATLAGVACTLAAVGAWRTELPRVAVICAGMLGVLAVVRRAPRLAPLVPLLVFIDLFATASTGLRWADGASLRSPPDVLRASAIPDAPPPRLYHSPSVGGALSTLVENTAIPWGIAYTPGHESTQAARLHALWDTLAGRGGQALDLMDIEWLVLPHGQTAPPGVTIFGNLGDVLLARRTSRGRLALYGKVLVVTDANALALAGAGRFAHRDVALVAPGPDARELNESAGGACRFERYAPERVEIGCAVSGTQALLVVAEGYGRGWSAWVDGQAAPIVRANVAMRGVYLAAGDHRIVMTYRTPGLVLGAGLSCVGIALALTLVVRERRRDRRATMATA